MIGIIVPANIKYAPYVQNYLKILKQRKINYKIMSWDRTGLDEPEANMRFRFLVRDSNRKRVLLGHIKFSISCKDYIKKKKIDKLIIFTAASAFFLGRRYLNNFKNNFVLDIRDDSPLIRRFPTEFKKICSLAKKVVISSPEFMPWTGRETILCHNADLNLIRDHENDEVASSVNSPIRIAFAGLMIEENCNIDVLKQFKGDSRFIHIFIGRDNEGKDKIKAFVEEKHMENVVFEGEYKKDDIIDIYRGEADLVNIFRAETIVNRNALPNKFYEAVIAGVPFGVFAHNKAITHYARKYNLGIVIPENTDKINDFIYEQIHGFDYDKYIIGRSSFLSEVKHDMSIFEETIVEFANMQ